MLSVDGRRIAFSSTSSERVAPDTSRCEDAFMHRLLANPFTIAKASR
jgi:hypothetical protein